MSVCDTAWQGSQHVTVELKLWTRHVSVEEVWPKFPRAAGSVVCAGVSFSGVSSMRQQPKKPLPTGSPQRILKPSFRTLMLTISSGHKL